MGKENSMNVKRLSYLIVSSTCSMLFTLLFLFVCSSSARANTPSDVTTRYVATSGSDSSNSCTDYNNPCASIQHAVDVSGWEGDEIRVASGTYFTPIYIAKQMTIRGGYTTTNWNESLPLVHPTILDAQGAYDNTVHVYGNAANKIIEGFYITGAYRSGIYGDQAAVTILNNQIFGNGLSQYTASGGIYLDGGFATISGNKIYDNNFNMGDGGGAGLNLRNLEGETRITITDNEIISNSNTSVGGPDNVSAGGIYISYDYPYASSVILENNHIAFNRALTDHKGGGIVVVANYVCSFFMNNNIIESNTAQDTFHSAGGMLIDSGNYHMRNNSIILNNGIGLFGSASDSIDFENNLVASNIGGGVHITKYTDYGSFIGNTIISNTIGGGLRTEMSTLLDSNIIRGNQSDSHGGGFYGNGGYRYTLYDNIIMDNVAYFSGGGIAISGRIVNLERNIISSNATTSDEISGVSGGGLYLSVVSGEGKLVGNVINNNYVGTRYSGSGISINGSNLSLINNTVAQNDGGDGSGIYINARAITLTNTLLVSHAIGISVTQYSTVTINGIMWHQIPITISQASGAVVSVQNQYQGDPLFEQDGYHLTTNSPAVDRGVQVNKARDIDGYWRPAMEYDIGADELIPSVNIDPTTGGRLVYTDTQGNSLIIDIPVGAVQGNHVLFLRPFDTTTYPNYSMANYAFELSTFPFPNFLQFDIPAVVTFNYTDDTVNGEDEEKLSLLYWDLSTNPGTWKDASCGEYMRYPVENRISVPICHLSDFAFTTEIDHKLFLPILLR